MKWRIDTDGQGAYALVPADIRQHKGWTTVDRFDGTENDAQHYKIEKYGTAFNRRRP